MQQSVLVHRGPPAPMEVIREAAREALGGHLRPDAALIACRSAPVRVRQGDPGADPLAGTVTAVHLAAPAERGVLTDLSDLALRRHLGVPPELRDDLWSHFGQVPLEAVGCVLSRHVGSVAVVAVEEAERLLGGYAVFSGGRRVWSARYLPDGFWATWDGEELLVEPLAPGDPPPPEGSWDQFPAHGVQLLFRDDLRLPPLLAQGLLPALLMACRPPRSGSTAWVLVDDGRFVAPGRVPRAEELADLPACFSR